MPTKKVTKRKTATKAVTKKAKSIKTIQAIREGFKKPTKNSPLPHFRYLNTTVSDISNPKFPEMVQITAGPSKFSELFGKKYVNEGYAKIAIDTIHADCIVDKGRAAVKAELAGIGILTVGDDAVTDGSDVPLN
jgi:hypothetical protein